MTSLSGNQKRGLEVHLPSAPTPPADPGAWNSYFEDLYRDAAGDAARIPWADEQPNPALVAWLNREAPNLVRPGASVVVVGCGLGEDVVELAGRGYDPVAFDVSPTAVAWARRRHPGHADRFLVADLFELPSGMLHRADLVVEVNTIQAVHPTLRGSAARSIGSLARSRGMILAICRGRDETDPLPESPPFPISPHELTSLFEPQGWIATRPIDDFLDEDMPPRRRLRGAFRRG